jgi:hypothetical protein
LQTAFFVIGPLPTYDLTANSKTAFHKADHSIQNIIQLLEAA